MIKMVRRSLLLTVAILSVFVLLSLPNTPKQSTQTGTSNHLQSETVAIVMDQLAPTGYCQDCGTVRKICYQYHSMLRELCIEATHNYQECNDTFNTNYQACAGECWYN
jgi:hypothetical protein